MYFIGGLNAHLPAMGYARYNNNGREIKRLIRQNKIIHVGPDFRTLVHKNGKPDIIFSNRVAYLNYAIKTGDLTSSDHFPVILKLSTRPIVKAFERKRNLKKTNWEAFSEKVETRISQTFNLEADILQDLYGCWYGSIEASLEETTPTTKLTYYLHARDSDYLKLLEVTYRNICNKQYWTREDIEILKNIQQRIREEDLRLFREEWERKSYIQR